MMKKIAVWALAILLISSLSGFQSSYVHAAPHVFPGGDGSVNDPYQVASAEDLDAIRNYLTSHFKLTADIDLTDYLSASGSGHNGGKGWAPIGSTSEPFQGTLDGDGHIISNLYIDRGTENNVGLFANTYGYAVLKNIGIQNASVKGNIVVGALTGRNNGVISNAFSTGVVSGTYNIGGLAGNNDLVIKNSFSTATVNSSGVAGGLVGSLAADASIELSFAAGIVNGDFTVGGIVGNKSSSSIISDSFYDMDTSGMNDTGKGDGRTAAQMKQSSTYIGWDFDNVWQIKEGTSYPSLRVFGSVAYPPDASQLQSAVAGDASVTLTWSGVPGAAEYRVYQRSASGSYGSDYTTVTEPSYTAASLTNGTRYYFVVTAVNEDGESAPSNEMNAMPQVPAPGAPVLQSATPGDGKVQLSWTPVPGAVDYQVFHSEASGTYGNASATVTGSVYELTGLTNGTTYYFIVKATNPGGDSAASNEVSAKPAAPSSNNSGGGGGPS
ncbi:fibronectin type III domain-containing protein, partial [Cohnella boryungensis]